MQRPQRKQRHRFQHTSKGHFEGVMMGVKKTPDDPTDSELWTVAIDTSNGSGSEWVRRVANAEITTTDIRPSKVERFEKVVKNGR